jgi:putative aldouronate transport system permease protein
LSEKRGRAGIIDCCIALLFILLAFVCLYPFWYVVISSVSSPAVAAARGVILLPAGFSLDTYRALLAGNDILHAFLVSLARTVVGTSLTVLCSSFLAFLVSHERMRFRSFVYRFVVVTMYLNAGLIPWYLTMKAYGLRNTFLLYVLPGAVSAYYCILVKTYVESLPASLEEAARIDGAGLLRIFGALILPLCKPVLATIAVFECVNQWNSWVDNYFLADTPTLQTLQLLLWNYLKKAERLASMGTRTMSSAEVKRMVSPMSVKMCITVIVSLPIVFAYPFLQRYFVKGIMMGAVKG